jgi:hypothetical protein
MTPRRWTWFGIKAYTNWTEGLQNVGWVRRGSVTDTVVVQKWTDADGCRS